MPRPGLVVLKFGGSVLKSNDDLSGAVLEIYRHLRAGHRVVAVVSALAGRTDELLQDCRSSGIEPSPHAAARLLALGEHECAARLALRLDQFGISASARSPEWLGLRAEGASLDATLCAVNRARVRDVLERHPVLIVPGFTAIDWRGDLVTLGRGGSDLTALFLASTLEADRCVLIKDVDRLYDLDPRVDDRARPYVTASFDAALATDGSIIQHKAVRFARDAQLTFELAGLHSDRSTLTGDLPTKLAPRARSRVHSVALLGLGTVGGGVADLLAKIDDIDVVGVAVRDPRKPRDGSIEAGMLTTYALDVAQSQADVVVEAIGGVEPARSLIEAALEAGSQVVSANKAVLAAHGASLQDVARRQGVELMSSAAVGGSLPLLERLEADPSSVVSVRAVLNGTTNFVLSRLASGLELDEAVLEAQSRGFAEADPSRDLNGLDAADKLVVIATALGERLDLDDIDVEPLERGLERIRSTDRAIDSSLRHVALLDRRGEQIRASVRLQSLDEGDPLLRASDEWNAAEIERRGHGRELVRGRGRELVRGRGAGRWATALAVVADVLEVVRQRDIDPDCTGQLAEEVLHVA